MSVTYSGLVADDDEDAEEDADVDDEDVAEDDVADPEASLFRPEASGAPPQPAKASESKSAAINEKPRAPVFFIEFSLRVELETFI